MMESRCTIQRTCSAMNQQKEKEDIDGNRNIVSALQTTLSVFEPLLIESFGSEGLAVFVQNPNGSILLTRSGLEILNVLIATDDSSAPIRTFLLNYCTTLSREIGDGVKRFIFYTNALITLLMSDIGSARRRLKQLEKLRSVVNLCNVDICSSVVDKCKLEFIIKGFMITRFTLPVASRFSELVFNWIMSFHSENSVTVIDSSIIRMLLKNLSILCVKHSDRNPLLESKVQNGFIVKGKIGNVYKNFKSKSQCLVKVFQFYDENSNGLQNFESGLIKLITEINPNNVDNVIPILLITNAMISESLMFYLRIRNVVILEGVLLDDVIFLDDYILKYYSPKEFVTDFKYVNGTDTIWISVPYIFQLIVNSPTDSLWSQLYDSLKNLLTMISYSLRDNNIVYDVGNNFELLFCKILRSKCKTNKRPPLFINGRKELLEWNELMEVSDDKLLKKICVSSDVINIEDELHRLIEYVSCLTESVIISVNNVKIGDVCNDDIITFLCDLFYYLVRIVKPKNESSDICLELATAKLGILSNAIDLLLNVFNIDSLVWTKQCF